jgi:hypothetical protein
MRSVLSLALLLPAVSFAAPTLGLSGSCPGPMDIDLSGFTPDGRIGFLLSRVGPGSDVIPSGPCAGVETGLSGPRWLNSLSDADGAMSFSPSVPDGACTSFIQMLDVSTCTLTAVGDLGAGGIIGGGVPEGCPQDWLVGTECNGVDFGGGCTPEETGYHFNGYFNEGGQDYACWWHTKNQAWNTTSETNFYSVAENFSLVPGAGGSIWCYPRDSDPCASGACNTSGSYHDIGNVGAWGWCGDGPFLSGGHMCLPVDDGLEASCVGGGVEPYGFQTDWVLQAGTLGQYTKCESVTDGGTTCVNPEIKYGAIEGGMPHDHVGNDFVAWCTQLGFSGYETSAFGTRECPAPGGQLFGCTSYDEATWHWCDWSDGYWLDEALDYPGCNTGTEIASITCIP